MYMKKIFVLVFVCFLPFLAVEASESSALTLPNIQVFPIKDSQSDRQYELYIKLPEGYSENKNKHYPVIYYTDAIWHVELLSAATEYLMKDVILVGVSWQKDAEKELVNKMGEHVSRFWDYSIQKSSKPEVQSKYNLGQANGHLNFIRNDVMTMVESKYRTEPDNRTYFGFSLGGLFGSFILLTQPEAFKNYILGSPALGGDIPYLSELEANVAKKRKGLNANVFITYGELEKEAGENVEKLISLLKSRNDTSLSLKHIVIESADHSAAFPATGVSSVTWLSNLQSDGDKS